MAEFPSKSARPVSRVSGECACTASVRDVIIEHVPVRIVVCEGADRADRLRRRTDLLSHKLVLAPNLGEQQILKRAEALGLHECDLV